MIVEPERPECRSLRGLAISADLAVIGGGLAGTCAAITAARAGIRVCLVQDRPVLGGNSSSEVRLWVLGATSHMGNNNRWAREGGVLDEILVENLYRNPEGNPVIFDSVLLEKASSEPHLTLLLNTAVYEVRKNASDTIASVRAFCSQNQTRYEIAAPLFCDASGDGIAGFLAGAAFRMGAESREEFGEGLAPDASYGELLGHTIYFYSRDTGRPVAYVAPSFALRDITAIPRYRDIRVREDGCQLWWLEWGGRFDTIAESERIKWELWRVAYGVWDYVKNSGRFPEAANLTLEWVGMIPGKRESRRFEGPYMLTQGDIVERRQHPDAVSFGGWAMDMHPADGVYSDKPACQQWHAKGVYQIPYRCLYSRNLDNLFLAGRGISASHVAFSSSRVMATCANSAQAVGMAAALCVREGLKPADLSCAENIVRLQTQLQRAGQHIPGVPLRDPEDLAPQAEIRASSTCALSRFEPDGSTLPLDTARAMLLPFPRGAAAAITLLADVTEATAVQAELRTSARPGEFTPECTLAKLHLPVAAGSAIPLRLEFPAQLPQSGYVFVCLAANPAVRLHLSARRLTGVLSLSQSGNRRVAKAARQEPPEGSGVESFEFWLPSRRPEGKNLALTCEPALALFGPENVVNGFARPTDLPNAWVADPADARPRLSLRWPAPQAIARIDLGFDADFDHPLESVFMGHPERVAPFCVKHYRVLDSAGRCLHEAVDNHQARNSIRLASPALTDGLDIEIVETHGAPAALFEVRCYGASEAQVCLPSN